jgi:hypothetical protein
VIQDRLERCGHSEDRKDVKTGFSSKAFVDALTDTAKELKMPFRPGPGQTPRASLPASSSRRWHSSRSF